MKVIKDIVLPIIIFVLINLIFIYNMITREFESLSNFRNFEKICEINGGTYFQKGYFTRKCTVDNITFDNSNSMNNYFLYNQKIFKTQ